MDGLRFETAATSLLPLGMLTLIRRNGAWFLETGQTWARCFWEIKPLSVLLLIFVIFVKNFSAKAAAHILNLQFMPQINVPDVSDNLVLIYRATIVMPVI